MSKKPIFRSLLLFFMGFMLAAVGGCASATPVPSATPLPVAASATSTATLTLEPTATPVPTLTATPLPPTPTETSSPIPTDTPTPVPSLTPTRTPAFNLPGLYTVGRCMNFNFKYGEPAPGGIGNVDMCLINVQINKDRTMQFNFTWHLVSMTGPQPNRYVYGNIDFITLTDQNGNRYAPITNSGKKPDRDENKDGVDTTAAWYLFPAPSKDATAFTLHDDDGKSVSIPYISFITR